MNEQQRQAVLEWGRRGGDLGCQAAAEILANTTLGNSFPSKYLDGVVDHVCAPELDMYLQAVNEGEQYASSSALTLARTCASLINGDLCDLRGLFGLDVNNRRAVLTALGRALSVRGVLDGVGAATA